MNVHGPAKYIVGHPDFPFIVVSPQCPAKQTWSGDLLLKLLEEVCASQAVDRQRVYLTGLSMGGFGTWNLGLAHPELFAAIAPICGGGNAAHLREALTPQTRQALIGLPVWAFHGAKDNVVPVAQSESMVQALRDIGAREVKLTIYPEAKHDSWSQTYSNPEFYQWLLEHKRASAP